MAIARSVQIDGVRLREDFHSLCDAGGRFAGTKSELEARAFVAARLAELGGRDGTAAIANAVLQALDGCAAA